MGKDTKDNVQWYKRTLLWVGLVIIIIAIMGASTQRDATTVSEDSSPRLSNMQKTATPPPEPTTFKAGDVISFDDQKVTVASLERNWSSGSEYEMPESGNEFVKVKVAIENDSVDEVSYNTFDWKMQDSKGVIKDSDSITYSVDGALSSGELAPSGKVSGFLIFEVPDGDTGLVLRYAPSFWADKNLKINL